MFVAGELEILTSTISKVEYRGRIRLLKKIVYYSKLYDWKGLLKFYDAWLRWIETGLNSWGDDASQIETAMLSGHSSVKKSDKGYIPKSDQVWWCSDFNRDKCTYTSSTHQKSVKGHLRQVKHICGTCLRKDSKQLQHPETSAACPYKIWLYTPKTVYNDFQSSFTQHELNSFFNSSPTINIINSDHATRYACYSHSEKYISRNPVKKTVGRSTNVTVDLLNKPSARPNREPLSTVYSVCHNQANYIKIHDLIHNSGQYNFEACKFPLHTKLNIDYFSFHALDYKHNVICGFWSTDSHLVISEKINNKPLIMRKRLEIIKVPKISREACRIFYIKKRTTVQY